jgi:hypothetical protein
MCQYVAVYAALTEEMLRNHRVTSDRTNERARGGVCHNELSGSCLRVRTKTRECCGLHVRVLNERCQEVHKFVIRAR